MKEKRLYSFEYLRYAPLEDLPEAERRLANCAAEACSKSYAPYSDFRVGAAALLDDGEIVSAANQESADTEKRQGAPIRLILCGACSATVVESARALLPFTFELE